MCELSRNQGTSILEPFEALSDLSKVRAWPTKKIVKSLRSMSGASLCCQLGLDAIVYWSQLPPTRKDHNALFLTVEQIQYITGMHDRYLRTLRRHLGWLTMYNVLERRTIRASKRIGKPRRGGHEKKQCFYA